MNEINDNNNKSFINGKIIKIVISVNFILVVMYSFMEIHKI